MIGNLGITVIFLIPLSFDTNKLVIGTESSPFINPNISQFDLPLEHANVWINNQGPPFNHNIFCGNPNQSPIEVGTAGSSILSHLGGLSIFCYRQQFSPGYNLDYVMAPFIVRQYVLRKWTLPELRMLTELGYSINPAFESDNSLFPFDETEGYGTATNSEIISNHSPFRLDYNVADKMLSPLFPIPLQASEDGFTAMANFIENEPADFEMVNSNTNVNTTASTLPINLENDNSLSDWDNDPITVYPGSIFGIRGVSHDGNNHARLVLDETRKIFTYTPEPGFHGRAQFGFYLFDGKEMGAMEVYTIDVSLDESVNFDGNDEMLLNGDYEDGIELRTWEEPDKFYTNRSSANNTGGYHYGYKITGAHPYYPAVAPVILHSADKLPNSGILGDNGFGQYGSSPSAPSANFPFPSNSSPINRRYSQLNLDNLSTLKTSLIQGNSYVFTFEVGINEGSGYFGDVMAMSLQIIGEPSDYPELNIYQEIPFEVVVEALIPQYTQTSWQSVSIPFTYCGNEDALYVNLKRILGGQLGSASIDNLSLKINPNPPTIIIDAGENQYITSSCDGVQLHPIVVTRVA